MGSEPVLEGLRARQHLVTVELLSHISTRHYSDAYQASLTTREDVQLLPRDVLPCSKTSTEVFGNYLLRSMGEPIRELRCDKKASSEGS